MGGTPGGRAAQWGGGAGTRLVFRLGAKVPVYTPGSEGFEFTRQLVVDIALTERIYAGAGSTGVIPDGSDVPFRDWAD